MAETIRCIDCKRECEPINDSDMPVIRCVDCAVARANQVVERLRPMLGSEWTDAAIFAMPEAQPPSPTPETDR